MSTHTYMNAVRGSDVKTLPYPDRVISSWQIAARRCMPEFEALVPIRVSVGYTPQSYWIFHLPQNIQELKEVGAIP